MLWPLLWLGHWHGHGRGNCYGAEQRSPIEYAQARYAKGEITKTEYESIKATLDKKVSS